MLLLRVLCFAGLLVCVFVWEPFDLSGLNCRFATCCRCYVDFVDIGVWVSCDCVFGRIWWLSCFVFCFSLCLFWLPLDFFWVVNLLICLGVDVVFGCLVNLF